MVLFSIKTRTTPHHHQYMRRSNILSYVTVLVHEALEVVDGSVDGICRTVLEACYYLKNMRLPIVMDIYTLFPELLAQVYLVN
jgi:hypothetical protein